jgi:small conductance mechanosensitive channel
MRRHFPKQFQHGLSVGECRDPGGLGRQAAQAKSESFYAAFDDRGEPEESSCPGEIPAVDPRWRVDCTARGFREPQAQSGGLLMDTNALLENASVTLVAVAWKIAGAAVLWLVGRSLISLALRLTAGAFTRQKVDLTLTRYVQTALKILLNVALVVAILGFFGVETTTFAALLAAGGVAIGVAWGGLLANFAAGVFLVFLRPFKVGDVVSAGGVTGVVEAVGLFGTVINTPDNVQTLVGNNKIFSDTIQNFSANPYRRVDLTATISNSVDHRDAIRLIKQRVAAIPNVLASPAPDVDVLQFTPAGPLLCVRPYCGNEHYWQVYFDVNRTLRETFTDAGFPVPVPGYALQSPGAPPLDIAHSA